MHAEILQELGLSPNEAKIYEALITFGGSGVSTISLRSGVHRRNAYDTLHRLIEKGLVSEVFSQGETLFEAVDPGKLMEVVKEKERRLEDALPGLMTTYQSTRAPQRAYIYKGLEGMKNFLREALKVGEDMYEYGAKGGWFDPRLETFTSWFLKEAKRKKMTFHHIFDWEVQEKVPRELPHLVADDVGSAAGAGKEKEEVALASGLSPKANLADSGRSGGRRVRLFP